MEKTKEYQVAAYKTDYVYEVEVTFKEGHLKDREVKTFSDDILAKAHMNWAMFEAWDSDKVESVKMTHVIWHTIRTK